MIMVPILSQTLREMMLRIRFISNGSTNSRLPTNRDWTTAVRQRKRRNRSAEEMSLKADR